jgi:hypothetical protein
VNKSLKNNRIIVPHNTPAPAKAPPSRYKPYPARVIARVTAAPPSPHFVPDIVLEAAGYDMWRVLDANQKLTSLGISDFEHSRGFDGVRDGGPSLDDIDGIMGTLQYTLPEVWNHHRDRQLMLSCEHLEQFIAARRSLHQRERFRRTKEVNRTLTSSDWMWIARQPRQPTEPRTKLASMACSSLHVLQRT